MMCRANVWESSQWTELDVEAPDVLAAIRAFDALGSVFEPPGPLLVACPKRLILHISEYLLVLLNTGLGLVKPGMNVVLTSAEGNGTYSDGAALE